MNFRSQISYVFQPRTQVGKLWLDSETSSSDPVTRALLELSHTIGLHVVYGCILTMEAEMSSGNTDTGATEHVPSGIYGKFANAYSRILVSSNLKKKKKKVGVSITGNHTLQANLCLFC